MPSRRHSREGTTREERRDRASDALHHALPGGDYGRGHGKATPCRRRRELWRSSVVVVPMLLTAAPIQLRVPPSDPNELRITGLGGGSSQWTIVILMTFLTLIPSMLICMTPFARLLIVFHFLQPGARAANYTLEPNPHWPICHHDLLPHAAGG